MNNVTKKNICMVLAAAMIVAMLSGCGKAAKQPEQPKQSEPAATTESQLQAREGIQTMLVLCLDTYDTADGSGGFRNANQADFAMLMVIDEKQEKITSVQLNPDTMVSFAVPGKSETVQLQLGKVFSYGSGGSDSCLYVTKAVSGLLGGIKVDNYLTFTMDAIAIVNDMIGGVSVPVEGSEAAEEEVRTLSGAEAVEYFTSRDPKDISNEARMQRQQEYMGAMFKPFLLCAQTEDFLTKLSMQLGERMGTGLTLSQLIQMFETMSAYHMDEDFVEIPGNISQVDGEIRFDADQSALKQIVNTLFLTQ